MSSSSSSSTHWTYDVFLNFRGEDARYSLVSDLRSALERKGILAFIDDGLRRGMEISEQLMKAIEGSRISIVVLSRGYASSSWCLNELVKIMECRRTYGQMVVPIFYGVDPAVVRHQRGSFAEHMRKHERRTPDKLGIWKSALSEVANISGFEPKKYGTHVKLLDDAVDYINGILVGDLLSIPKFQVGLESRVKQVIKFIEDQSSRKGCVVGLLGMGGLGKTTIAKGIYNLNCRKFKHRCFIDNIREVDVKNSKDCIDLQEKLLSGLRINTTEKIYSSAMGTTMIEKSLFGKRSFIVLDDVTDFEQLEALCGNRKWIDEGSVVIITTRDERLLNVLEADHMVHICRINEMDGIESLELFSWHAFGQASPREDFKKLSIDVATYCEGLPLALEVLGSYLFGRKKEFWEEVLSKLKEIPNGKVQKKLQISYDDLDCDEKKIFLDICFFFIGKDRADVTEILEGCGFHPVTGITTLVERSLIKFEKNDKLKMHDLLRDMGREIVRQSYEDKPEKRSRLWIHKEVLDVLSEQTPGTNAIEGLTLKLQRNSGLHFNTKAFKKMKKLRLLQFDHVQLVGDYEYLNKNLRWVCWQGFPLKHIPGNLYQGNVISIELKYSNIREVWKETQLLERLKILNLSHSRNLIRTPDFSKLPNLAKLILKDCPSLSEVHQSIGDLTNLLVINLMDCTSLSNLPRTIYQLKSVKTLIISGCSKIDKLEEDIEQMESLITLLAKDTTIKEIPHSIVRLKGIGYISLCGHEGLACHIFPSLIRSWMSATVGRSLSTSQISMDIQHKNCGDLLTTLIAKDTAVKEMPRSIERLKSIGYISLCGHEGLARDIFPTLIRSWMSPTANLVGSMSTSQISMDIQHKNCGGLLPLSKLRCILVQFEAEFELNQELRRAMDGLCDVKFTELEGRSHPSQISENSMEYYMIRMGSYDQVINMLNKSISEALATNGACDVFLPGDNDPYWLAHMGEGHSVHFTVPKDCRMKGMTLCVVYSSTPENTITECLISVLMVNYTKCTIQMYKQDTLASFNDEDWQGMISHLGPGDMVEIFVNFGHRLVVKKTSVYLICDQRIMDPSPEPKKARKEMPS